MADTPTAAMRVDLFLWYVRLAKTRSNAQAMATSGRMRIGGRLIERAHCPVRAGDVLTFVKADLVRVVRVVALPTRRGPAPEAQACYEEVGGPAAPPGENVSQTRRTD